MASEYVLITDSSCDLPPERLKADGIAAMQLSFTLGGETYKCSDMTPEDFYTHVRAGGMPITAQVNVDDAVGLFTPLLEAGRDILYLAFSSGLSGTCASGQIAAKELSEKYPARKIIVVDTLCGSMGQGLIVHKVLAMKNAGAPIGEAAAWAQSNRLNVAHYVVVDDLMHLHRGGRVSKTSAVVGSMLGIKPLIQVNDEGKLVVVSKVRGRRQSLDKGVELMAAAVGSAESDTCYISHADCREDAEYVARLIRKRLGVQNFLIDYIGPVIGSHTGAGTVAIFMMAEHR